MEELAGLRLQAEASRAEARRLRLENGQLRRDLRRALSQEASAGQLHRRRVGTAAPAAAPQLEADASAGSAARSAAAAADGPEHGEEGAAGAEAEAGSSAGLAALQAAVAEAEAERQRLRRELQALGADLREGAELQALGQEVVRMRELLAQPEEAWLSGGQCLPEAGDEAGEPGAAPSGAGRGGERAGALLAEVSFEMLATIGEAEFAEEKKALQRQVRRLRQELASPPAPVRPAAVRGTQALPAGPSSAEVLGLRQRRRLQQMDAIAQRLHEEFKLRAAASAPATPGRATSSLASAGQLLRSAGTALEVAQGGSSARPRCSAKKAASDARGRELEARIRALSRRFLLLRDVH